MGKEARAPLEDRTALIQLFVLVVGLYTVFTVKGTPAVKTELINEWAAISAVLWALPLYLVWCLIRATFLVLKEERKEGHWSGTAFFYHTPVRVLTVRVTDKENDIPKSFYVRDAERGGSIQFRVEFSGLDQRVRARLSSSVYPDAKIPWNLIHDGHCHTVLWTGEDKEFFLETFKTNSNPSILQVYVDGWNTK